MGDEGVRAFERFAAEQKFVGSDRDFSPSWGSGFKKRARLPRSGERQDGRSERSEKPSHERKHSRGRRRDRDRRSPTSRSRRRAPRGHFVAERAKSPRRVRMDVGEAGGRDGRGSRDGIVAHPVSDSETESLESRKMEPMDETEVGSLGGSTSSIRSRKRSPFHPSKIGPAIQSQSWRKPARYQGPHLGSGQFGDSGLASPGEVEEVDKRGDFSKPAVTPVFPAAPKLEPLKVRDPVPVAGAAAKGSKEKESKALLKFDERCLGLYTDLNELNQEMEISEILRGLSDDKYGEAFAELTRPKRAATGLMYVRLMESYLGWYKAQLGESKEKTLSPPSNRDVFWLFLHHLKSDRKGKYSPKVAYLAMKYFADCFGFSDEAITYRRAKKLVDLASKPEGPRNQAEMIPVATLDFLECAISDPTLTLGVRVAAGKLRLCCQASMRWDDLARTPMGNLEWVRRRGSGGIVGLRSLDAQSKTGVRPWVASYLGVTEHSDDWLAILVKLLLEIHGSSWQLHDHTGKSFSPDGKSAKVGVASFSQDVGFVRALLLDALEKGVDVGLDKVQASNLRWHGSKATLTSFMMHCKVSPRAVRFAGNWKDQRESMPDTYLREAQLLVLDAQETVLNYIRGGGFVATLEGLPLGPEVPLVPGADENADYQLALKDVEKVRVEAPPPQGLEIRDVARAVLDKTASDGEGLTPEVLIAEEKAAVIGQEELERVLDATFDEEKKDPQIHEGDPSGGESSSVEFYESCYLQVPQSLRGSLHKPSVMEPGLPRCGTRANGFAALSVEEKFSKKTTFCGKCFGKVKTGCCDKVCARKKKVVIDGAELIMRCSRRCALKCERLAGYLDVDERPHLCSVHCDPAESSPDEKEDADQVEELPELKEIASSGATASEASPPQKKPEKVDLKDI